MDHTARNPHGHVLLFGPGKVTVREADMLHCPHCDGWWEVVPGSGRTRGWCVHCGRAHCGGPQCWTCRPFELVLDRAWQRAKLLSQV